VDPSVYMYGKGQNPGTILSQLDKALEKGDHQFDMSGGEQLLGLPACGKVAEYIVKIAMQNQVAGIINCCSGKPISIRKLVENSLTENGKTIIQIMNR